MLHMYVLGLGLGLAICVLYSITGRNQYVGLARGTTALLTSCIRSLNGIAE